MSSDDRTMRERMEAGDLYIAVDPELGELSSRALDLVQAYNAASVRQPGLRRRPTRKRCTCLQRLRLQRQRLKVDAAFAGSVVGQSRAAITANAPASATFLRKLI